MPNKLFRDEALKANQVKWVGDIILIRPVSFTFLTLFAVAIALAIVAFLIWGSYTKRTTVQGQLMPSTGLVKVYATEAGITLEKKVSEGQKVQQGDVLYTISTTRYGSHGDIQEAITKQVNIRDQSLQSERSQSQLIHQDQRLDLSNKIKSLKTDLAKLDSLIESQRQRVALSKDTLQRYQSLLDQDYIAREQVQQKKEELLDQQSKLQSYERDKISTASQLNSQQIELESLSTKQRNELSQFDRQIAVTHQELTESQAKQKIIIRANDSGVATAVAAEVGQQVDLSKPMLSIVPEKAVLLAQLYVPSKAIGFIKKGDRVLLRYQAYPYQKFGHATGTVTFVTKTALPSRELNTIGELGGISNSSDPVYLIKVALNKQTIQAYGKPQSLQVGMSLEADIMHEKRHLYEWVLEPLYSITGKL